MIALAVATLVACDSASAETDAVEDTVESSDTATTPPDIVAVDDTAETQLDAADEDTVAPDTAVADTGPSDVAEDAGDTTGLADVADDTVAEDTSSPDASVTLFAPLEITPASGFEVETAGRGFTIYRKDYAGGSPDWVTVVDLRIAELRSVVGETFPPPTASVEQRAAIRHWDDAVAEASSERKRARVLFSGAFFSPSPDPAPLAHGLEIDESVISYGYGIIEYQDYTNTVAWNNDDDTAEIAPYAVGTFEAYPNVVGGVTLDIPRDDASNYLPRVFIGVLQSPLTGSTEMADALLFLTSTAQNQPDAEQVLSDFGATAMSTWTGGNTAIFIVDGEERVSPGRKEPHTVGVYEPLDYGCAAPCPSHASCDTAAGQCVCDAGYSGSACETCEVCAPSEVIVDDGDPEFTTFGFKYWWEKIDVEGFETRAHGGDLHYTLGDESGEQVYTGRWLTPTPLTGTYKIEAHIPSPDAFDPDPTWSGLEAWEACDAVRYIVLHDGAPTGELVVRDQHVPGWITLAEAASFSDRHGDVRVDDHAAQYCTIFFDAIRWTRVTQ